MANLMTYGALHFPVRLIENRLFDSQLATLQPRRQRLALYQFYNELARTDIVQRADVRVIERAN